MLSSLDGARNRKRAAWERPIRWHRRVLGHVEFLILQRLRPVPPAAAQSLVQRGSVGQACRLSLHQSDHGCLLALLCAKPLSSRLSVQNLRFDVYL
jgi:hypothetical protein